MQTSYPAVLDGGALGAEDVQQVALLEGFTSTAPDYSHSAATSYLTALPTTIVSLCIGSFLEAADAHRLARCSRRSLQQLQQYEFRLDVSMGRMQSLNPPYRRSSMFGVIRHVRITTADEWRHHLPNLPTSVTRVTILIRSPEITALYPPSSHAARDIHETASSSDCSLSPIIILPPTVVELSIDPFNDAELLATWLDHLRLHPSSRLKSLYLQHNGVSLPPLVHDLPESVTVLELPCFKLGRVAAAKQYPARWPPNLTRLMCSAFTPFAQLPALPPTITDLDTYGQWEDEMMALMNRLPATLTALKWLGYDLPLTKQWSFPSNLTWLSLSSYDEPIPEGFAFPPHLSYLRLSQYNHPFPQNFAFPLHLTELELPRYCQPELRLPPSLTTLELKAPSLGDALPFERIHWPATLSTLIFGDDVTRSLRGWTPPPNLTHLNIGSWNLTPDHLPLPDTLLILSCDYYKQSFVGIRFPPRLQELRLFGSCMPSLGQEDWTPPPSLTAIRLTKWEDNLYLPPTLKRLTLALGFRIPSLQKFGQILPSGLLELDLTSMEPHNSPLDTLVLPPSLRCLRLSTDYFDKCNFLPRAYQFPSSMQECYLTGKRMIWGNISQEHLQNWLAVTLPESCVLNLRLDRFHSRWLIRSDLIP